MARTSKYIINKTQSSTVLWRAGLYCRLSKEDIGKSNFNESDSIESQKYIQQDYLTSFPDISVIDYYIDDGFTGGNEDRPNFQRMLNDLNSNRINCIIVKDLSRFTRNEIAQLHFTQVEFAKSKVRFIAILDRVDSYLDPDSVHSPKTKMKGMLNENFLRDTSRKVRSILNMKREEGEFIGAFSPYGYLKDPNNHNKLIIDPNASKNVNLIFKLFLKGRSIYNIAITLNKLGIPNPAIYKKLMGMNYRNPNDTINSGLWSYTTVKEILTSRIYVGDMVQGKRRKINYKVKDIVAVPKEEWFIKENTHEAIVDKDEFETIQVMLNRDTRTSPKETELSLFAGFLRCADCNHAMIKKRSSNPKSNYHYYVCRTYEKLPGKRCTRHGVRTDILEKALFEILSKHIETAVRINDAIDEIKKHPKKENISDYLIQAISITEKEKAGIESLLLDLYPDYKCGLMSTEIYLKQKERLDEALKRINTRLLDLKSQLEAEKDGIDTSNSFVKNFIKYKNITTLTREVLIALVDCIYISENGTITIELKYKDAYLSVISYIEKNVETGFKNAISKVLSKNENVDELLKQEA